MYLHTPLLRNTTQSLWSWRWTRSLQLKQWTRVQKKSFSRSILQHYQMPLGKLLAWKWFFRVRGAKLIPHADNTQEVNAGIPLVCSIKATPGSWPGLRQAVWQHADVLFLLSAHSALYALLCWEMESFKSFSSSMRSLQLQKAVKTAWVDGSSSHRSFSLQNRYNPMKLL